MADDGVEMGATDDAGGLDNTLKGRKVIGPADQVAEQHKLKGFSLYTLFVICFLIFVVVYVIIKANERNDPPITFSYEKEKFEIPDITICPSNSVTFSTFYCDVDEYLGDEADCDASVYIDEDTGDDACVTFDYTDAHLNNIPAEINLELLYKGTVGKLHEFVLFFGDDWVREYYINAAMYNHAMGVATNIIVEKVKYTYLKSDPEEQWQAFFSSTQSMFTEYTAEGSENITCEDTAAGRCEAVIPSSCSFPPVDGEECGFFGELYIYFQTQEVKTIAEVDPMDIGSMLGVFGGYWVYVGALFGLFFAANPDKDDGRLHPTKVARRLLCLKD